MYKPNDARYENMRYNRCGKSGLMVSALSLGFWHNFGDTASFENMRELVFTAFDSGITVFDLANNYGPPEGAAEINFGRIMREDLRVWRDEMVITTKAGYYMWPGPYGEWGSRKSLLASLDQSLSRMGLEYVDIFYHHRPDPDTPIEESMLALDTAVRSGKALYVGLSNYTKAQTQEAVKVLRELRTPFVIHQPSYSMLNRWIEADGLRDYAAEAGFGLTAFSPLAQGMLTDRYLKGIPADSRIAKDPRFLHEADLTEQKMQKVRRLNAVAKARGQTLAQMAVAWILREGKVASVLIGASRPQQIIENVRALDRLDFTADELEEIEAILA